MTMHHTRSGRGKPILLIHGLGGSHRSWDTILAPLAKEREVIAVDLPGHGQSLAEADHGTFAGLARSVEDWLVTEGLQRIDMVGSSMGARLVLEMARRGRAGAVVALDPGGFWQGWERTFFRTTITASIALVRALRPTLPALAHNVAGRTALMLQLSAKPWALHPSLVLNELRSFAGTSTFNDLVKDLATGPMQEGPPSTDAPTFRRISPLTAIRSLSRFPQDHRKRGQGFPRPLGLAGGRSAAWASWHPALASE